MVGLVLCVKSLSDPKKNNIFCLFFLESNLKPSLNETMLKGFGISTYSSTSICNSKKLFNTNLSNKEFKIKTK